MGIFHDRSDAGRKLADRLLQYAGRDDVVVLALPRGGVPVAYEVARRIHAPLDIFLVRKLGVPGRDELAMGAIASGGVRIINVDVVRALSIPDDMIDAVARSEQQELERREREYRGDRMPVPVTGRVAILVDDGLATGASMSAAVEGLRMLDPARIVVAVPTAAPETCAAFRERVDEVVCAETPQPFHAVGLWYEDFSQTTDEEVRQLLSQGEKIAQTNPTGGVMHEVPYQRREETLEIEADGVKLEGDLTIPENAGGIVLFAHGSGSSRHSSRNRHVARLLQEEGLATLLFDLLTEQEESIDLRTRELRFDIDLLARRMIGATDWLLRQSEMQGLDIGYFGASTGAAAALIAAAERPEVVHAVVSRGGRPDLAGESLSEVKAATLLIVGGDDVPVIGLNQEAFEKLRAEKKLEIVPGATHLFEEPGALDRVAELAGEWFRRYLAS
jgi:putative phosphoribosyl transferase